MTLNRYHFGFICLIVFMALVIIFFMLLPRYFVSKSNPHNIEIIKVSGILPATGINYIMDGELVIQVDNKFITVPKGFETDLASIPRFLWPIFAPNDDVFVFPGILHDYLYSCDTFSRKFADDVLLSFLLKQGALEDEAYDFYAAVRVFGGSHFDKRHNDCDFDLIPDGV